MHCVSFTSMDDTKESSNKTADTTDAFGWNIFKGSTKPKPKDEPEASRPQMSVIDKDSVIYNMNHTKRGLAIIFNHLYFDDRNMKPRLGTEKDVQYLKEVLTSLEFEVRVYDDLKYGEIYDVLLHISRMDHSNSSCFLLVVMSHGDVGEIHSKDHSYKPESLWLPFAGDKCKTLAGKPKMFFIQACRGENVDSGTLVRTVTDASTSAYNIPAMSDILVMYSSYDGYFSWRSPVSGSWFIQCLCKELEENAKSKDLMTILVYANRRMAINYKSNVPGNYYMHQKKQIGSINTTFTRLLYFYPENII